MPVDIRDSTLPSIIYIYIYIDLETAMCAQCPEKTPLAMLPLTISVSLPSSMLCAAMMLGRLQALYIIHLKM